VDNVTPPPFLSEIGEECQPVKRSTEINIQLKIPRVVSEVTRPAAPPPLPPPPPPQPPPNKLILVSLYNQ